MQEEVLDASYQHKKNGYKEPAQPNSGRAKATVILLLAQFGFYFLLFIMNLVSYFYEESGEYLDNWFYTLLDVLDNLNNLTYIATAVLFLMWFARAYKNVWRREKTSLNPAWAVWSWFIPVYNLFKPIQLASEITVKNERILGDVNSTRKPKLALWWIFWLLYLITGMDFKSTEVEYSTILVMTITSCVFAMVGCVLAVVFVKFVSKQEDDIEKMETEQNELNFDDNL